ncbi:MarR family winged helix-turn-helix transcriptional regulator [Nocardiopsis ansamitocini]|uniref:MarR family transcriptional regulator n=1 Tax=Nocardiopsis ansamitocini TaxID=1670832 RepID=A0A9W6P7K2_9ACTN|nr:MarR family transcriptional regulator [Nocardiopsis ansamitocini]GLU48486.1 MarR family transcriptional regulator [Nocardiopsis ansamitocini]
MVGSDATANLSLDSQLCFSIYSASRALTGVYRELLDELDLTYPQYLVMLVLWEHDALSVKELGASLRLDSGTLSPLLRRLELRGLVRRSRTDNDERIVRVALTEDGIEARRRAEEVPQRVLCSTGLSMEQVRLLKPLLDQLTESVVSAGRDATRTQTVS